MPLSLSSTTNILSSIFYYTSSFILYILAAILILFSFSLFLYSLSSLYSELYIRYRCYRLGARRIPSPPAIFFFGHFFQFLKARSNTLPLFEKWCTMFNYNTFNITVIGGRDVILVNDPASIKHILSSKFREGIYGKGKFQQDQYRDFIGEGIFNANGPEWKHARAFASHLFQPSALRQHISVFQSHGELLVSHLSSLPSSHTLSGIDMQDYFLRFTLDSFLELGFGVSLHAIETSNSTFARAFDYVQGRSFRRLDYGSFWKYLPKDKKFYAHLSFMNNVVSECIEQAKLKPRSQLTSCTDLLSLTLVSMTNEDGSENDTYSEKEIRDTVMNFLIAGRDTTAMMLTWFFYLMSQHPQVAQKVRDECSSICPSGPITYDQTKSMLYTHACLQETLRLYPSVPFNGFTSLEEDILPGNYYVPKDTYVTYSAYLLHRTPHYYKDPRRFDPDRFLTCPPQQWEFMAFHGGPRACMGQDMAYAEAKVMIVTMYRNFTLKLHEGFQPELKRAIILSARKGVRMDLIPVKQRADRADQVMPVSEEEINTLKIKEIDNEEKTEIESKTAADDL